MTTTTTTNRSTTPKERAARPRQEAPQSAHRTIRLQRGLSQNELAVRAGLSPSWVSMLERSPSLMTTRAARALAEALGVSPEELLP